MTEELRRSEYLERCVTALEQSGEYRILRRLEAPQPNGKAGPGERVAVILDTETTGLDPLADEIIELGLIAVAYDEHSRLGKIIATYNAFQEPTVPITAEISALTGISYEMVKGQAIDVKSVEAILQDASLVVAHNAGFDRPFCERLIPSFAEKPWGCSATDVPWRSFGFEGVKLAYLTYQSGYFHKGHRALDDAGALLKVLSTPIASGEYPFHELLHSARKTRLEIRFPAPVELRQVLRRRGYRWKPQVNSTRGYWHKEVERRELGIEERFITQTPQIAADLVVIKKITALNRFKLDES